MQILSLPPSKVTELGFLVLKVAQCCETYEKTIFRFSVFEIWVILYSKYLEKWEKNDQNWPIYFCRLLRQNVLRCAMFWIVDKINFPIFAFWDKVDFVIKILSELGLKRLRLRLFVKLIQKRYPVISDNQLAKGIQSKTVQGQISNIFYLIFKWKKLGNFQRFEVVAVL